MEERAGFSFGEVALTGFAVLAFAFLMVPSIVVVILSFSSAQFMTFPPPGFSLRWYVAYFNDWAWIEATTRSLIVAIAVTILATALGTAAALAIVRHPIKGTQLLYVLIISPIVVPAVVLAISIYSVFAKWHMIGSYVGLILAHTVLAIPFVVMNVSATLHGIDASLERAAMSMGAPPWVAFRKVLLPLIQPGVFNGAIFAFITSFDEIIITLFIASTRPTLPKKMYDGIELQVNPTLTAVATIFVVTSAALLVSSAMIRRRERRYA